MMEISEGKRFSDKNFWRKILTRKSLTKNFDERVWREILDKKILKKDKIWQGQTREKFIKEDEKGILTRTEKKFCKNFEKDEKNLFLCENKKNSDENYKNFWRKNT